MLNENAATDKQETHYFVHNCATQTAKTLELKKTSAAACLEFHTKKIHKNLPQITFFLSPWLNFPRRIFSPSTWSKRMAAERSEKTSNHKFPRLGLAKTSKKIPSEMEVVPRYIQLTLLTLLIVLKLLKLLYISMYAHIYC